MSVAEMQACLARLYVDGALRRLLTLEPETVLGAYRLSAEEARALRDLDRRALERFASSLKSKRRRRFAATYPLLFRLASPAVERYYDRYYQLYPARPGGSFVTELLEFGRFMEESLAADDEAPPFAGDLARYERILFATRYAAVPPRWEETCQPAGAAAPPVAPEARPRLADGVVVGTFRTGILAIVEALEEGLPPPATGEGPYTLVFRPAQDAAGADAFYVTTATRRLLDACDGERTLADLIAAAERRQGGDGTAAAVAGAVQALVEYGILTTASGIGAEAGAGPGAPLPPDPEAWLPGGH